jgi:hypothetical protein
VKYEEKKRNYNTPFLLVKIFSERLTKFADSRTRTYPVCLRNFHRQNSCVVHGNFVTETMDKLKKLFSRWKTWNQGFSIQGVFWGG